jgi:hypothetical protein
VSAHECVDETVHDVAIKIRADLIRASDNDYAPGLITIERIIVKYQAHVQRKKVESW